LFENIVCPYVLSLFYFQILLTANKTGSTIFKEWTTSDFRNTPSTTNLEEEEIVDAPGNDGNASMPEQFKRPNPRRKMIMMMKNSFALQFINPLSTKFRVAMIPLKATHVSI
jgi:hypothetical protein